MNQFISNPCDHLFKLATKYGVGPPRFVLDKEGTLQDQVFVAKCSFHDVLGIGKGHSKKEAKTSAAKSVNEQLNYNTLPPEVKSYQSALIKQLEKKQPNSAANEVKPKATYDYDRHAYIEANSGIPQPYGYGPTLGLEARNTMLGAYENTWEYMKTTPPEHSYNVPELYSTLNSLDSRLQPTDADYSSTEKRPKIQSLLDLDVLTHKKSTIGKPDSILSRDGYQYHPDVSPNIPKLGQIRAGPNGEASQYSRKDPSDHISTLGSNGRVETSIGYNARSSYQCLKSDALGYPKNYSPFAQHTITADDKHSQPWEYRGVSDGYGDSTRGYGPTSDGCDLPPKNYDPIPDEYSLSPNRPDAPLSAYGDSSNGYDVSLDGYGASRTGFEPSTKGYGPSHKGYSASPDGYETTSKGYGSPDPGYGPSTEKYGPSLNAYEPSSKGYDSATNNYGPSSTGYGPLPDECVPSSKGYGGSTNSYGLYKGYGTSPNEYAPSSRGYSASTNTYGPSSKGYNASSNDYGPSSKGYSAYSDNYGSSKGYKASTNGYGPSSGKTEGQQYPPASKIEPFGNQNNRWDNPNTSYPHQSNVFRTSCNRFSNMSEKYGPSSSSPMKSPSFPNASRNFKPSAKTRGSDSSPLQKPVYPPGASKDPPRSKTLPSLMGALFPPWSPRNGVLTEARPVPYPLAQGSPKSFPKSSTPLPQGPPKSSLKPSSPLSQGQPKRSPKSSNSLPQEPPKSPLKSSKSLSQESPEGSLKSSNALAQGPSKSSLEPVNSGQADSSQPINPPKDASSAKVPRLNKNRLKRTSVQFDLPSCPVQKGAYTNTSSWLALGPAILKSWGVPLNRKDQMLITKIKDIRATPEDIVQVMINVDHFEKALTTLSEKHNKPGNNTILGAARVGELSRGTLLKSDRSVNLVLLTEDPPTLAFLQTLVESLTRELSSVAIRMNYQFHLFPEEAGFCIVSLKDVEEDGQVAPITINVTLTSNKWRNMSEKDYKNGKDISQALPKDKCLRALSEIRHFRWFDVCLKELTHGIELYQVLRDLTNREPNWSLLSDWSLELITERALISPDIPLTPSRAFRRVFEVVACGMLLPNGIGLRDPCESENVDALGYLTDQQREDITRTAQHFLRLVAFGKVHEILDLPPPPSQKVLKPPLQKQVKSNGASQSSEASSSDSVALNPATPVPPNGQKVNNDDSSK